MKWGTKQAEESQERPLSSRLTPIKAPDLVVNRLIWSFVEPDTRALHDTVLCQAI